MLETKSGKRRHIPVNSILRDTLYRISKHPESPYIFTKSNGQRYKKVPNSFFTALKKSGIKGFHLIRNYIHCFDLLITNY